MATIPLDLDGYTDLPPGRIANIVTYLEMLAAPPSRHAPADTALAVRAATDPAVDWYRKLYRRIGERWLWSSRLTMDDEVLRARLANHAVEILILERDGTTVGFAELDRSCPGEIEIAMFGVVPEEAGTGASRFLMNAVLARAWVPDIRRLWLHTCSFDHPAAIPFYLRAGFKPFKFAIEVMPDPRLSGHLPLSAAPHIPVIDPDKAQSPRRT
jgi:N-acetylglutamate synthase-like GNAT family acetyltransferase